jgi:hypothetical protein
MDDLDQLLSDLQETGGPSIDPTSDSLIQELTNMEAQLTISPRKPLALSRHRSIEIISNLDKISKTKLTLEKSLVDYSKPAKTCHVCGDPIQRAGILLNAKTYHQEHFQCNICDRNLRGLPVFEMNERLWCEKDYHKTFSPQCFYCKEPITDVSVVRN